MDPAGPEGVVSEPDIEPPERRQLDHRGRGAGHAAPALYEVAVTLAVMPDGQVDYWRSVCDMPRGRPASTRWR